jgi:hypothetical protein
VRRRGLAAAYILMTRMMRSDVFTQAGDSDSEPGRGPQAGPGLPVAAARVGMLLASSPEVRVTDSELEWTQITIMTRIMVHWQVLND